MAALGAAGDPAEELEQMVARHVLGGQGAGVEELQRMAALRWQSLPMCMLLCISPAPTARSALRKARCAPRSAGY